MYEGEARYIQLADQDRSQRGENNAFAQQHVGRLAYSDFRLHQDYLLTDCELYME
jgi:hypothetical protein